jgi:two-component system nitrogen regulation response regulator NtrX
VAAFAQENNFRPRSLSPEAMDTLKRQTWRGNIRELKNAVERVLIMSEGDPIGVNELSEVLGHDEVVASGEPASSLKGFKESAERAFLVEKLREHQWNISATAASIGTPRSNLYKKLEQYGISTERDG